MLRAPGILLPGALAAMIARGDEGEWRVGAGAGALVTVASAGGAEATGVGFDAHGRLGKSLTNLLEVGLFGSFARASDLAFSGATLDGQSGTLYADVTTVRLGAELRLTPGVGLARAFERTSPYVAVRAGGALVVRSAQELLTHSNLLLSDPPDALGFGVFVEGALGLEHRFGDHFFLAAELAISSGVNTRWFGLITEAAWAWY